MKKKVLFSAVALLAASATFAQGNGMAGIKAEDFVNANDDMRQQKLPTW